MNSNDQNNVQDQQIPLPPLPGMGGVSNFTLSSKSRAGLIMLIVNGALEIAGSIICTIIMISTMMQNWNSLPGFGEGNIDAVEITKEWTKNFKLLSFLGVFSSLLFIGGIVTLSFSIVALNKKEEKATRTAGIVGLIGGFSPIAWIGGTLVITGNK